MSILDTPGDKAVGDASGHVATRCVRLNGEDEAAADASTLAGECGCAAPAHRSEQFVQEYGVWLKEWRLLQRAIFVLDRNAHIVYAEYLTDQLREPGYAAAIQAVELATVK